MKFRERKMANQDSLTFVKLEDGESVTGVFAGDPFEFFQHWQGDRSIICPGKDECSLCKQGQKGSFRFRLNLIVRDGDGLTAKVFEQGSILYDYLANVDKDTPLEKTPVKITRRGTGKKTIYVVTPQVPLSSEQLTKFAKVPLLELAPQAATQATAEQIEVIAETADDLPF